MKAAPAERALGLALKVFALGLLLSTRKALGNRLGLWINGEGGGICSPSSWLGFS